MASVIFHAYHQINKSGKVKLFRSHNKNYKDGEQLRDFVYVKDVINAIVFLIKINLRREYIISHRSSSHFQRFSHCRF